MHYYGDRMYDSALWCVCSWFVYIIRCFEYIYRCNYIINVAFCSQASNQRADGPAESRSIAIVQHQAAAYTRPNHTAPADAFFAHITRIWQSRNSGRAYGHTGESLEFFYFWALLLLLLGPESIFQGSLALEIIHSERCITARISVRQMYIEQHRYYIFKRFRLEYMLVTFLTMFIWFVYRLGFDQFRRYHHRIKNSQIHSIVKVYAINWILKISSRWIRPAQEKLVKTLWYVKMYLM
jgi:hypothetical protein